MRRGLHPRVEGGSDQWQPANSSPILATVTGTIFHCAEERGKATLVVISPACMATSNEGVEAIPRHRR